MTETDDIERWDAHPTYSHFQVSTHGRVVNMRTGNEVGKGRSGSGYPAVAVGWISATGSSLNEYVHVLVLETFTGPRPEGHDADHIDHDRLNNRLSNLRWRPLSENRADTSSANPSECPQGHELTPENVGTYTSAARGTRRYCRTCSREKARARYRRRAS